MYECMFANNKNTKQNKCKNHKSNSDNNNQRSVSHLVVQKSSNKKAASIMLSLHARVRLKAVSPPFWRDRRDIFLAIRRCLELFDHRLGTCGILASNTDHISLLRRVLGIRQFQAFQQRLVPDSRASWATLVPVHVHSPRHFPLLIFRDHEPSVTFLNATCIQALGACVQLQLTITRRLWARCVTSAMSRAEEAASVSGQITSGFQLASPL